MNKNEEPRYKKYTVAIIVVSVLLALTLTLLIITLVRTPSSHSVSRDNVVGNDVRVTVPDNCSYSTKTSLSAQPASVAMSFFFPSINEKLTLSWWTGYDGEKKMELTNILPGDTESKEYTVTVKNRRAVTLLFDVEITSDSLLSEVLNIDVKANETSLYSGPLSDIPQLEYKLKRFKSSQEITYNITVSLPTSIGNEYAGLTLEANFIWSVDEAVSGGVAPSAPIETTTPAPEETTVPTPDETTTPEPPVTTPEPPVTTPEPPVTTPEPPVTTPEPPVTTPDPGVTPPDPGDDHPVDHECCDCWICNFAVRVFLGKECTRCVICRLISLIDSSETFTCVCPRCCVVFLLLIMIALALILWWLISKRNKEKAAEEAAQQVAEEGANGNEQQ